ncbi:hypothetical protein GCM10010170_058880 [Dactylosporangium salmoneum]|uniref:Uncharacterized protein n=1 Tax=Dactylosporangium salmoneum TaxID=53361 RepID=A0ABN3GW46_9ACTN
MWTSARGKDIAEHRRSARPRAVTAPAPAVRADRNTLVAPSAGKDRTLEAASFAPGPGNLR